MLLAISASKEIVENGSQAISRQPGNSEYRLLTEVSLQVTGPYRRRHQEQSRLRSG